MLVSSRKENFRSLFGAVLIVSLVVAALGLIFSSNNGARAAAPIMAVPVNPAASRNAPAVSPDMVISQVYGGAGCGTAGCSTYQNDYIELFNRGASAASLNGWSVQYASATGTGNWTVTALTNVSVPAGGYYLVAEGADPTV